ncbi:MAG: AMP-binding protein [Oscillospiraceae bacterium]|jgi:fatty-acyl-CoA synthase|nr:AMP-binding protein [Oscillospiraceae bacterium]
MFDSETLFNMGKYRVRFSGRHEAIYDYDTGKHYTYAKMDERSDKLAGFLVQRLGLKKGDRIGFCATNSVAFFDAYYAGFKTGIIITTYNCLLREKELFALIENESPRVIFYSEEFAFTMLSLREKGFTQEFICLDDPGPEDRYCYCDIMNAADYAPPEDPGLDYEDIQMLIHTGGTTGTPKAAMMSFRSLFYNALADQQGFQLTENDTAILTLPLFHTAGWNVLTLPLLMIGGRLIIMRGFNPAKVLSAIREERPTIGISVETMYKALAMHPDFDQTDFSCYRTLVTGAAPTGRELLELYWAKGVKMVNAYGMTEVGPNNMCHPISLIEIEDVRAKWNSCGIPAPYNEVRFLDDEGNSVPVGERGEMVFGGKLLFSGYWNNPEATAAIMSDGWIHTGDMGYLDKDGFCYISGRKKNMFISGGENIFPQEIEDVIMLVPGVLEACVIGVPDPKWGEVGRVLIVTSPGAAVCREDVVEAVRNELSSIKVPKYVTFVESVPKNAVGKRDLNDIRKLYANPEE